MLPGNGERGICLVEGDRMIGGAIIAARGSKAYLWGLYIEPGHQRRGIEVRVLAASTSAISFYKKHGFVETETDQTELPGGVIGPAAVMIARGGDVGLSIL